MDFSLVKDPEWRERTVKCTTVARSLLRGFIHDYIAPEVRKGELLDAANELGFFKGRRVPKDFDHTEQQLVATIFAALFAPPEGDSALKRLQSRREEFKGTPANVALQLLDGARYAHLEVLSVKSGFGMKCRDLATGAELFLAESACSSHPEAADARLGAYIVPVPLKPLEGEVYIAIALLQDLKIAERVLETIPADPRALAVATLSAC